MRGLSINALVRKVDLLTLKLFLTAIEERQIGRAAAREHIAPSAATKRIQDLEDLAGLKLFDRNAKGVVPNQAGQMFARHVRKILAALDEMRCEISDFTSGTRGQVIIASPRIMIIHFLAKEIGKFTRQFPLVDVEVRENINADSLRALASGNVDLAAYVGGTELEYEEIESFPCRTDRLVAVVRRDHRFAERGTLSLAELLSEEIIGTATSIPAHLRRAAKTLGRDYTPKYNVATVEAARSLVREGLGISVQPSSLSIREEADELVRIELDGDWAIRTYCVGKLRDRTLIAAAEAFLDQLRSSFSGQPTALTETS